MRLLKRISTTVTSSLDRAVSRVENHDAIINAALQETRQAAVRSRVRLARVQKDGERLQARRQELADAARRWTERARRIAADDQAKAIDCLRRRKECESQLNGLDESIEKHSDLEVRIAANLKTIEARISEVSHQRNLMRSRQSIADATRVINNIEGASYGEIEETFDRWEINLGETELMFSGQATTDLLASEFDAAEHNAALQGELEDLLREEKQS